MSYKIEEKERLYMNPGRWYDNGEGLPIGQDPYDVIENGRWHAVPFRVGHAAKFTHVGLECVTLMSGEPIGFALYGNDGFQAKPGELMYSLGFLPTVVFGENALDLVNDPTAIGQPIYLQPGWYWLAICQNVQEQNVFRCFNANDPAQLYCSDAHLGYESLDLAGLQAHYMIRTTPVMNSYDPTLGPGAGGAPLTWESDGDGEETNDNPVRLALKTEEIVSVDIWGCTDPNALNFNPFATLDDGSCIFNYNIAWDTNINDGSGTLTDSGGMNSNYNANENFVSQINASGQITSLTLYTDIDFSMGGGDYLKITDSGGGNQIYSGILGTAGAGVEISGSMNVSSGLITIEFFSHSASPTAPGFELTWTT